MSVLLFSGLLIVAGGVGIDEPEEIEFVETVVRLDDDDFKLALRDFDGDGTRDLVRAGPEGITLFPMEQQGRFDLGSEEQAPPGLAWPDSRVGWDFSDFDGDGVFELALLGEDGSVRAFRFVDGQFDGGTEVLVDRAYLPPGVSRVRFVRDVDGDGRHDLIFPGAGSHRIFFARDGGWSEPIEISFDLKASLMVGDPNKFSSSFGQEVRVPWFSLEDIDGDGRDDLVAETENRIAFHLAAPDLSTEPTWVLSLADLKAELPKSGTIDFDNLLSMVEQSVSWRIADLDGEHPLDLIVLLGSKFRIYLGGSRTGPDDSPDQVLKSSGNVLYSFVRQAEGDGLLDLQIVRAESISVGRVLRSIILPSAFDFDLFTYRNEGGAFSRRPTRRNRVTFEIPRLLSFMDEAEGLEAKAEKSGQIRATRVPRTPGKPAEGDGIADVQGNDLVLFQDCAPAPVFQEEFSDYSFDPEALVETYFLKDFDTRGDGANRTLDLGELLELELSTGAIFRAACKTHSPVARHPLAVPGSLIKDLIATDLNNDGTNDLIAVGKNEGQWVIQFLVQSYRAGH